MSRTISAYVTDQAAKRFQGAVHEEGRKPAQAAARAIDLYTLLPLGARRALEYVREHGTAEEQESLVAALTSAAARAQFQVAQRHLAESVPPERRSALTEQEIDDQVNAQPGLSHRAAVALRQDSGERREPPAGRRPSAARPPRRRSAKQ